MNIKKNAAFTLIELLVVVLIIGILAAVALPSYRKAVIKTRVVTLLPLLRSISDAQNRFFMANGRYTTSFEALDIAMPAGGRLVNASMTTLRYHDFSCSLRCGTRPPASCSAYCGSSVEGAPSIEKYYQENNFVCWAARSKPMAQDICYDITSKTTPDRYAAESNSDGFSFS